MADPPVAVPVAAALVTLAVLLAGWGRSRGCSDDLRAAAPGRRRRLPPPSGLRHPPGVPGLRRRPGRRHTGSGVTPDEVAASMVLLAVALQSGCGVVEAVEEVARAGTDSASEELGVVAAALRWGIPDPEAWSVVDPLWSRAELALRLAARSGVAPSSLLLEGAEDLWAGRLADLEVAAARVAVRLVLPLGAAFLPAFVLTTVVPVVLALARQVLAT